MGWISPGQATSVSGRGYGAHRGASATPADIRKIILKELIRSNNPVLLSFIEALLSEAGIAHVIADTHMSIVEGSLGVLPRRLLVEADRYEEAKALLAEAWQTLPEEK